MFKHTSALFNNFQDHMELRRHTARTRVHFTNEQRYAANKMPPYMAIPEGIVYYSVVSF